VERHLGRVIAARLVLALHVLSAQGPGSGDFSRVVQPLLAEKCFPCHGPDAGVRKGRPRLDTPEGAMAAREGGAAIVAGAPEASRLLQRVSSRDPEELMPPPGSGKVPLS
jgi:hypothetical protein